MKLLYHILFVGIHFFKLITPSTTYPGDIIEWVDIFYFDEIFFFQFKRLLNKELSHFSESKSGNQISEYICNTFLGEYLIARTTVYKYISKVYIYVLYHNFLFMGNNYNWKSYFITTCTFCFTILLILYQPRECNRQKTFFYTSESRRQTCQSLLQHSCLFFICERLWGSYNPWLQTNSDSLTRCELFYLTYKLKSSKYAT